MLSPLSGAATSVLCTPQWGAVGHWDFLSQLAGQLEGSTDFKVTIILGQREDLIFFQVAEASLGHKEMQIAPSSQCNMFSLAISLLTWHWI